MRPETITSEIIRFRFVEVICHGKPEIKKKHYYYEYAKHNINVFN